MPEAFDPYLRWLGIRDPGRPPNHYRLLGLDLFENDSDVIAVAADRQMAHVRTFQTGQFAALSQRVLNELAAARICLLKPEKKAVYDALLKKQLGAAAVAVRAKPQSDAAALPVAAHPTAAASDGAKAKSAVDSGDAPAEDSFDFASLAPAATTGKKPAVSKSALPARKSKSLAPWIGLAVAGFLLVVGVIAVQQMGASPEVATTDGPKSALPAGASAGTPQRTIPAKTNADKTPAPAVVPQPHRPAATAVPADHGNAKIPTDVRPTGSQFASKSSPAEPPVHSPRDVIHVENPTQPEPAPVGHAQPSPGNPSVVANAPTQVAQVDSGKPGPNEGNSTGGHNQETQPTPKNPASPVDQAADLKPKRAPVPSKEQTTASEAKVHKLFNTSAAKKPDERAALAKTLFTEGIDPNNQEVDRYVLLRMAMKDAETLGDADLAIKAADKLVEKFDVNSLDEKVSVLAALGKTVRTASAAQVVLGAAQDLLESALAADEFDTAKSLAQLAAGLAAKSGDAALARQMRQRSAEIDQIRKEYAKAAPARDTLKTTPDDPEANYVWGYYVGPVKGDFDRGLPYLSKGNEKRTADMAKKDLAKPADPKAQAALADGWLELSDNERDGVFTFVRTPRSGIRKRPGKLTGLEKKRVEDQLAKLEPAAKASAISGRNFIKFLTEGSWTINWAANPTATAAGDRQVGQYKSMIFYADGRCTNNDHRLGSWSRDGANSVLVRYPDFPTFLQRYTLVGNGQLDCEHYDPPGNLQRQGLGIKDGTSPK